MFLFLIIEYLMYNIQGTLVCQHPAEMIIEQAAAGIVDLARSSEALHADPKAFCACAPVNWWGLVEKRMKSGMPLCSLQNWL